MLPRIPGLIPRINALLAPRIEGLIPLPLMAALIGILNPNPCVLARALAPPLPLPLGFVCFPDELPSIGLGDDS